MRKEKKKAPTLDELVAQERKCRRLLKLGLRNLADQVGRSLDVWGRGLDWDADRWGKAAKALARAMQKKKAA